MSETKEKSPLEIIEDRREARRKALAPGRDAQYLVDMTALDALEEEYGPGSVVALHTPYFKDGLPTFAVVKSPGGTSYYKRFTDSVRNAKGNKGLESAAQDMLARASLVYPADVETQNAMLLEFSNMLNDAAKAAVDLVALRAEDEKKG